MSCPCHASPPRPARLAGPLTSASAGRAPRTCLGSDAHLFVGCSVAHPHLIDPQVTQKTKQRRLPPLEAPGRGNPKAQRGAPSIARLRETANRKRMWATPDAGGQNLTEHSKNTAHPFASAEMGTLRKGVCIRSGCWRCKLRLPRGGTHDVVEPTEGFTERRPRTASEPGDS